MRYRAGDAERALERGTTGQDNSRQPLVLRSLPSEIVVEAISTANAAETAPVTVQRVTESQKVTVQ